MTRLQKRRQRDAIAKRVVKDRKHITSTTSSAINRKRLEIIRQCGGDYESYKEMFGIYLASIGQPDPNQPSNPMNIKGKIND